jgi:hypothetical protein
MERAAKRLADCPQPEMAGEIAKRTEAPAGSGGGAARNLLRGGWEAGLLLRRRSRKRKGEGSKEEVAK